MLFGMAMTMAVALDSSQFESRRKGGWLPGIRVGIAAAISQGTLAVCAVLPSGQGREISRRL
jgi:hypothetical protein